ncbi:MAG: hypothetical protein OXE87_16260 [Chloroflexi bacterium]|nr:hypothetical protein [Chloroflexota bacterium]
MVATRQSIPRPVDWVALSDAFQRAVREGELDTFRTRRWTYDDHPAAWLDQANIFDMSQTQADALYRAAGGRQIQKFRTNPIEDIRDSIDFLLYDTIKLENRFEECALDTGGFGLRGAGKEWPSYLLTLRDPALFAPWSPHTERSLRRLGMLPPGLRTGHPGLCYIDLLDSVQVVRYRLGLPDFRAVDEFCYFNGRNSRGPA